MVILVTGGCGFIGHHLVEYLLHRGHEVVSLDRLDTAGTLHRCSHIKEKYKNQLNFVFHDLKAELNEHVIARIGKVDQIYHLAAASHVNRSIADPMSFVLDNVVGTCNLLNYARNLDSLKSFLYLSTDEIFGPLHNNKPFIEWSRYNSSNPYASTKAGAEELCLAYNNTYGTPIIIAHSTNVFGERQHPEKFIPMTVKKILNDQPVQAHAKFDLQTKQLLPGLRYYVYVKNAVNAAVFIMNHGEIGDKYNIPGQTELDNAIVIEKISNILNKKAQIEIVDVYTDRPGGDFNYALDGTKLLSMGYVYPYDFEESFEQTIKFTESNKEWMN